MRKAVIAIAFVLAAAIGSSCTPEQIELFKSLSPSQQEAVMAHLQRQAGGSGGGGGGDCYSALGHFSGSHSKARSIIWRESRNQPGAVSPSGKYRGCWQIDVGLYSSHFAAVGCSTRQWSSSTCNTKVANRLYRAAGWSPWGG